MTYPFKNKTESREWTPAAKKTAAVLFLIVLLLFPHFNPWVSGRAAENSSLIQILFDLFFFIVYQTLGIVHEAGHGICVVLHCPEPAMVANGTIFQLLFPALIVCYYKKRGNVFAASIALFFLGLSLQYTAWYMSTAHEGLILPAEKSFLGVDAYHDFNYLFGYMGVLSHEGGIALATKITAYLIMFYSGAAMLFFAFAV